MKLYFIEVSNLEDYDLSYNLLEKIGLKEDDSYFCLFKEDSYFANVKNFNSLKEDINIIITNDDRLLSQYEVDKENDLLFFNFNTGEFDSYRKFYPNIRKANNIENMWRRRIFPEEYYLLRRD